MKTTTYKIPLSRLIAIVTVVVLVAVAVAYAKGRADGGDVWMAIRDKEGREARQQISRLVQELGVLREDRREAVLGYLELAERLYGETPQTAAWAEQIRREVPIPDLNAVQTTENEKAAALVKTASDAAK
jgi:hypothetical protein